MKILITGGAGFIGSHTADALITAGHTVRLVDNLQPSVHPQGKPAYLHPAAEFIQADVRLIETWRRALEDIQIVYHLAAYQDYLTDFSTFFAVNTVSTALLYEVLAAQPDRYPVQKVIVAASQAVMGEGRYRCATCAGSAADYVYPDIRIESQLSRGHWDHRCAVCGETLQWLPSDESVVNPCNQYALSKHSQEQIAIQLGRRYQIPSVVMRYSIVQGPRQSFFNAYSGAMRIFALSLMQNRAPIIFEDGNQIRDFVNIADVVAANLLVLAKTESAYQIYNVGGGTAWRVADFYETMQQVVGKKLPARMGGHYRYGDTRHIFSDTAKLRALGWTPRRTVIDSIQTYWHYLMDHQKSDDILRKADEQMRKLKVLRRAGQGP